MYKYTGINYSKSENIQNLCYTNRRLIKLNELSVGPLSILSTVRIFLPVASKINYVEKRLSEKELTAHSHLTNLTLP